MLCQLQGAWQYLKQDIRADEVLLRERVPQNDLLGYGGLAAFVTQGGYLSMQVGATDWAQLIRASLSGGSTRDGCHCRKTSQEGGSSPASACSAGTRSG